MPTRDGVHDKRAASLLAPLSRNGNVNSVGQENVDGDKQTFLVQTGGVVNAGFLAVLEEGDTLGGAYTAVVADEVIGDTVSNDLNTTYRLGYVGQKAFARVALTIPGITECGVVGLIERLHQTPEVDV